MTHEEQLQEELNRLREDYETLEHNFDIMSEGYQESLLLYDKLEETYHELEETNRQLDVARQRAEDASRMKTNFIQQISHEIRTPLNILSGFTQVITTPGMDLDEHQPSDYGEHRPYYRLGEQDAGAERRQQHGRH